MVESPIVILIELLKALIENFIGSFQIIYVKLTELFVSLAIISGLNPIGFIIAVIFGSLVLFFILKFVFGSSKTLLAIFLFYFILMIIVAISFLAAGSATGAIIFELA
jgi:hypothetical protein